MQYTQQQLREKYENLPEDLKNAIFSVESSDAIQKISKNYGLMIDQMGELASETGLVMLGFTHPKDYIKNLSGRLGVDIETAKKIAQEINVEIFSKIKETLKKLHGISEAETPSEIAPVSKPPVSPPAPQPLTEIKPSAPKMTEVSSPSEAEIKPKIESFSKDLETAFPSKSPSGITPVELTEKHEATGPKPTMPLSIETSQKTEQEIVKKQPEEMIFSEKMTEQPFRRPSQTTEINPSAPKIPTSEKYPSGDPYKEAI